MDRPAEANAKADLSTFASERIGFQFPVTTLRFIISFAATVQITSTEILLVAFVCVKNN